MNRKWSWMVALVLGIFAGEVSAQQPPTPSAEENPSADNIIIGIHGLLNKPPEAQLTEWWAQAIQEGLQRNKEYTAPFSFDLAYWADVRNPHPIALDKLDEPYVSASGTGPLRRYETDVTDSLRIIANKWGGRVLDKEKDLFGLGTNIEKFLGISFEDLDDYYKNADIRNNIRGRLISMLEKNTQKKIIVVAHSMGSIVAYDVLRLLEQSSEIKVDFLLTIGSPLGLPIVSKKIRNEFGDNHTPTNVSSWTNIPDPRDKVALDTHLADEYKPNRFGLMVHDVLVHNEYRNPEGNPNYHKSYGYLRAPEVSDLLVKFLGN